MTDRITDTSEMHIYLAPEQKEYLRQWAFDERRTMADIVREAVEAAIEKRKEMQK